MQWCGLNCPLPWVSLAAFTLVRFTQPVFPSKDMKKIFNTSLGYPALQGWFKWGFKNSIEIIMFSLRTQACWDSQTLPCPFGHPLLRGSTNLEHPLQLWFNKLYLKVKDHSSRSTPGPDPSRSGFGVLYGDLPPLSWGCPSTLFYRVFVKTNSWGYRAHHTPFMHLIPRGGGIMLTPPLPRTFLPRGPPLCQILSRSIQQFGFL